MAARLAFVDDSARLGEVPPGFEVVALEPAVEVHVERAGLPWTRPEDHVDPYAVEADGAATFEELMQACDALDRLLAQAAGGRWSGSTHWHFRALKIVVDGVRSRGLAAAGLVAGLGGSGEALLLLREGSLGLDVLAAALPALGVPVRAVAAPGPVAPAPGPPSRLRPLLARAAARLRPRHRSGTLRVALLDELYGMPAISAELRARGADVQLFVPCPAPAPPLHLPLDLVGCAELRPLFEIDGVDLFDAALPRLRGVLERDAPLSAAAFVGAQAALARMRPDALLGSVYASPWAKAAASGAHAADVPVIVCRHGELGLRDVLLSPLQDLDAVDVALCWGAFEAAFVARHARRPVRTTIVGAPSMEAEEALALPRGEIRARLGFAAAELVALYVPTDLSGEEWVTGRRAPPDSDYVRHQRAVALVLAETEGLTSVVKPHPAPDDGALEAWAREALPALRILREPRFAELVHMADAVLLDFPSTALVQALRGSARIYVVDHPLNAWEPGVREHLEAHGVVFVDVRWLAGRLHDDLRAGLLGRPASYSQEAREPLAASGPGTAAARAADAVIRIAAGDAVTTIRER